MYSTHDYTACLSLVPIFETLPHADLKTIATVIRPTKQPRGTILYQATDLADTLYIVDSGQVKIYQLAANGREQLLHLLNPGDFDGEYALFKENQAHQSYAETLTEATVCEIRRQDFQKLLLDYPSIALRILNVLAKRIQLLEQQTTRVTTESIETRLALYLLDMADADKTDEFKLPMKKKELATYLGTTPETISRKLTAFEEAGYIKQIPQRMIQIRNRDGLLFV
ncbi:Crp/Fnr family transcriptional regulator [Loigolactobacillus backii]|uniref:Crp/Fnr family transcriptional regulator n=1 Tax=Loigolactobacillus backii TaxID=375175 RepID=A0A192H287_9LACO|nr:Crp/Fnr family transcriptional regulator [Loigolactobacillus backii]ANK62393.1 Crp/Fnr family transcriptional regulator [Loigolactobacillus backii]ANK70595.1 Crp/Fnr family transcriptional regulator [Loigolactobacillus backii]